MPGGGRHSLLIAVSVTLLFASGCYPSPQMNIAGYMIAKQADTLQPFNSNSESGAIQGLVVDPQGLPVANATVLVAERTGIPYSTRTDGQGRYLIEDIPAGKYVPAAIAPGFHEVALHTAWSTPWAVEVETNKVTSVPDIQLDPYDPQALPANLADAVELKQTSAFTATAPYPVGSTAQVTSYQFINNGAVVDTLRLYRPLPAIPASGVVDLPLIFMVYPTSVDLWESVSVAYAAQGYSVIAISPIAARKLDIDAHAQDALVALTLATTGQLDEMVSDSQVVALGGSFSSAILIRLLRDARDKIAAWVTVGGIGNAFTGTADFYAERIGLPEPYTLLIPALGSPRLFPLPFLRYSPVYSASSLPPTQIIHTAADAIIPIEQALELEEALRSNDVPVEVFYYDDVSHYLQIGENMTATGQEMFHRVLNFIERYSR